MTAVLQHSQPTPESANRRLRRAGVADVSRANTLLAAEPLQRWCGTELDLIDLISQVADPDLALLQLTRLVESASMTTTQAEPEDGLQASVRPSPGSPRVPGAKRGNSWGGTKSLTRTAGSTPRPSTDRDWQRLVAVLGASTTLGDELIRRPDLLTRLHEPGLEVPANLVRAELLWAVGADPESTTPIGAQDATDALRRAYRARLLLIAADDLTSIDPLAAFPAVAAALADLAAAALEAALAVAQAQVPGGHTIRLAVIAMGKTGGRELNYISDVDVVYVHGDDTEPATAAKLAASLQRVCAGPSGEPPLWQVDTNLRPEGRNGPLTRDLGSFEAYWNRWAQTWEFQALLKAREVAGDQELSATFTAAAAPLVWQASTRENFVADVQAMRRRVESLLPKAEAEREIKLGHGGLRDVEFTVQLLQMVHGRTDPSIRAPGTLDALEQLAAAGYVGRDHAGRLGECYRFLRALEHRVQLHQLRRTHLLPTDEDDLRRLARSLGMRTSSELLERWKATRREVRQLHELIYYRPLLPAYAGLPDTDVSLNPDAARARLAAIGYRDPDGALRHITALTTGTSRRATLQRHLLPVLLGWFAEGVDPDAGLLAFRGLSDDLGGTHWYLKLLRDSGTAAHRLTTVLSNSKYVGEAISRSPESIHWFDDDASLQPRRLSALGREAVSVVSGVDDDAVKTRTLRAMRRRELARTGAGEVLGLLDPEDSARAISNVAEVLVQGALPVAVQAVAEAMNLDELPSDVMVVALGRLGGREMGYGSDADVMFVHEPQPGVDPQLATQYAQHTVKTLRDLLGAIGPEPPLPLDAELRPEGRSGPMVRTLSSYADYYQRWMSPWEAQALLRARPLLPLPAPGTRVTSLAEQFTALIDLHRYPAGGLDDGQVREIRRIKARVESERLPRGVEPARHLKLGPGGVADVEWAAQLLQLRHAHAVPALRTTETLVALRAACEVGLLSADDFESLSEAWKLASCLRSAVVLTTGRTNGPAIDLLPHDATALTGVARLVGLQTGAELSELYLRTARRARAVMERVFYGN